MWVRLSFTCNSPTIHIHSQNTRYLKKDSGTISFEESLNTDVWTQQTTSMSFFFPTGATTHCGFVFCSPVAGLYRPRVRGFLITHNDAPQSLGLLWTSDQLVAETSTWQHTTLTTNIDAPAGIRTHDLSGWAAENLRLRPRGYWDRHFSVYLL